MEDDHTPATTWGMGDAALGIVASLVLSLVGVAIVLGATGEDNTDDLAIWVTAVLQVPLWLGLFGAAIRASTRKGTGRLRTDFGFAMRWADIPIGLAAGFLGQLVIVAVSLPLYELLGVDTDEVGQTAQDLADRAVTAPDAVVLVLIVVVFAPVIEELFYRGLLMRSMERRWGQTVAVLGSAVVFAAVHFQVYDLLPLALAGLLFALLAARTGRLGPSIWAHVAFNLTAVAVLLASS